MKNAFRAFTLVELAIVVAILSIIAMIAASRVSALSEKAKTTAAEADMNVLRRAIVDAEQGYLADLSGIPGFSTGFLRLGNLFISTNLYGRAGDGRTGERVDEHWLEGRGVARPEEFTCWNEEAARGWHGPYAKVREGAFPEKGYRRFEGDGTSRERGFYPNLAGLDLPRDFLDGRLGCSIYGFPGEPAAMDPWGNPYVLQIPPPQAWQGVTNVADETRFAYARIVSAGADGILETPCFGVNSTNWWATAWNEPTRRSARQAGRVDGSTANRGDDLVLFLFRADVDEGMRNDE